MFIYLSLNLITCFSGIHLDQPILPLLSFLNTPGQFVSSREVLWNPFNGHWWFFWQKQIFHHRNQGQSSCSVARGELCMSSLFVEYYIYHHEITVSLLQSLTTVFTWPSFARRKVSPKEDLRKQISCHVLLLTYGFPNEPFLPRPERPARSAQTPALPASSLCHHHGHSYKSKSCIPESRTIVPVAPSILPSPGSCLMNSHVHWRNEMQTISVSKDGWICKQRTRSPLKTFLFPLGKDLAFYWILEKWSFPVCLLRTQKCREPFPNSRSLANRKALLAPGNSCLWEVCGF